MAYGRIMTAQDAAKYLQENNRTYTGAKSWGQMYNNIDLGVQQAESAIKYDYAQDVADAYIAAKEQRSSLYGSNLGAGYKQDVALDINNALEEAYNKFKSTYQTNVSDIRSGANTAKQQISDMLSQQSEYFSNFANKHIDYLTYLQPYYSNLKADENYKYFANYYTDTGDLLSEEELYSKLFNANTGQLSNEGITFFDLVENTNVPLKVDGEEISFANYLAENDEELYNWTQSQNPYTYAPGELGYTTNISAFRKAVGLDSADITYDKFDKLKIATNGDINKMFENVKNIDVPKQLQSYKYKDRDAYKQDAENYIYDNTIKNIDEILSQYNIKPTDAMLKLLNDIENTIVQVQYDLDNAPKSVSTTSSYSAAVKSLNKLSSLRKQYLDAAKDLMGSDSSNYSKSTSK